MKHKVNLYLFLIPIMALGAINIIIPKHEQLSTLEKRSLSAWPAFSMSHFTNGQYFRDIDNFFADRFVFRNNFVELGSSIKSYQGLNNDNSATLMVEKNSQFTQSLTQKTNGSEPQLPENTTSSEPSSIPAAVVTPPTLATSSASETAGPEKSTSPNAASDDGNKTEDQGKDWAEGVHDTSSATYLIIKDQAMNLYHFSEKSSTSYANAINDLRLKMNPAIPLYVLLAPFHVEFLNNSKYTSLSDSQAQAFQFTYSQMNPAVIGVDATKELQKHSSDYIYFRSDHHWTGLGAYYAYSAFMKARGEEPVALNQYTTVKKEGFLGTAYSATLSRELKKHPDTVTVYNPFTPYEYRISWSNNEAHMSNVADVSYAYDTSNGYRSFLNGDSEWGEIKTSVKNNKRLLVIKDSYGNAFIPFLLPHYELIYFIDPRQYKGNIFEDMKKYNITETLVLSSAIATSGPGWASLITSLNQSPDTK